MAKTKVVKIISLKKAKNIVDGVIYYGVAQSRSRGERVNHGLVARRIRGKLVASCSCEAGLHYRHCGHGDAFIGKILKREAAEKYATR